MTLSKSFLLVATLVILAASMVIAANPFDTSTQPFAVGGQFKRLEKKSPSNYACYNSTISDWSELRWGEVHHIGNSANKVQLKTGEVIFTTTSGGNTLIYMYSPSNGVSLLTTKDTIVTATNDIKQFFVSYDQKKLYIFGEISKVGNTVLTSTSPLKVISFEIKTGTFTFTTFTELTSNYVLTNALSNCYSPLYPLGNGNLICYQRKMVGSHVFVVYDGSNWKVINPASLTSTTDIGDQDFLLQQSTGNLYAKGVDGTSRATSFYKFDNNNDFQNIRTLQVPPAITNPPASFVAHWALGSDSLYYTQNVKDDIYEPGFATQNIQQLKLDSPATSVSLASTRLVSSLNRAQADNSSIAQHISSMYYDYNIKKLVLRMNSDTIYQVYGSRDTWSTDLTVAYRWQLMGELLAYDEANSKFTVPYGGGYRTANAYLLASNTESGVSCIATTNGANVVYYRTWAPNFALYDPAQDKFVADDKAISGQLDTIFPSTSIPSTVVAIENSHPSGLVYIGGYFRSINNVVYNSIVSRTREGVLSALSGGLLQVDYTYDNFDRATPGVVQKLIRSNDNRYLFVLGTFNKAGTVFCNGLAIYNIEKQTWSRPEGVFDTTTQFTDMDYDGRYLYVIGNNIVRLGRYVVKNVARYEVSTDTWTPMNGGIDSTGSKVFVYNGRVVVYGASSGSSVSFTSSLAVWDSNAWKGVRMSGINDENNCYSKQFCTSGLGAVSVSIYRGNAYFIGGSDVKVPSDNSFSYITTYTTGAVPGTGFFNYPKSNTLGIATLGSSGKFYEFNYNTMNLQHTQTRDDGDLADATIYTLSSANRFQASFVAMLLVALLVALFF